MRFVIQRVNRASVTVNGNSTRSIGRGLMVLAGIAKGDEMSDIQWLTRKLLNLRIFEDDEGKMNLSIKDIDGEIMVVSQFTLFATTKKGNRPGFNASAAPDEAIPLYNSLIDHIEQQYGKRPATGEFGADMDIDMINHGPVTIMIDSKNQE
ncbi:MAG: D-aminoacyl-tRNA deacylase [Spirochaetales bacterium]|uniref:D-aminoacyl-tRNA deacylase n=1 Tax=Candidatus Thalassospirochaeta sargassi TaxID=3119039 RepID=A0AAJ1IJ66_9SPIO|nr:D-aminoacyl-tRNA deacylase [Spirochaetales bacterium]